MQKVSHVSDSHVEAVLHESRQKIMRERELLSALPSLRKGTRPQTKPDSGPSLNGQPTKEEIKATVHPSETLDSLPVDSTLTPNQESRTESKAVEMTSSVNTTATLNQEISAVLAQHQNDQSVSERSPVSKQIKVGGANCYYLISSFRKRPSLLIETIIYLLYWKSWRMFIDRFMTSTKRRANYLI